jgi:hypothetical protein
MVESCEAIESAILRIIPLKSVLLPLQLLALNVLNFIRFRHPRHPFLHPTDLSSSTP